MAATPTISLSGIASDILMSATGSASVWEYVWTVSTTVTSTTATVSGTDLSGNAYMGGDILSFNVNDIIPFTLVKQGSFLKIVKNSSGEFIASQLSDTSNFIYKSSTLSDWNLLSTSFDQTLTRGSWYSLHADNSGNLYVSTKDDGIFKSSDDGIQWTYMVGSGYGAGALDINGTSNYTFALIGGSSRGIYRTPLGGASWTQIDSNAIDMTDLAVGTDLTVYSISNNKKLFTSSDAHTSATNPSWNENYAESFSSKAVLVELINDKIHIVDEDGVLYRNDSGGWTSLASIPFSVTEQAYLNQIVQTASTTFWLGTINNGVWLSRDSGSTWVDYSGQYSGTYQGLFVEGDVVAITTTSGIYTSGSVDDNTIPTLTLTDTDSDNLVSNSDVVTITATFSESMAATPTISLSGVVSDVSMSATASDSVWTYTWTVSGSTVTSTTATVSGTDLAGNAYAGTDSITFAIDNTAPTVTLTDTDSDNIVSNSDVVTITATFSESMAATPTLSLSGIITNTEMTATASASVWTYAWTVSTTVTSTTATVYGTDLAGNAYAGTDSITFTIDNSVPTVKLTDTDSDNLISNSDVVTITATFSESMSATPTLSLSGIITNAQMTATASDSVWTYAWTVSTSINSTTATVSGKDLSGNAYAGSDSITFTIDNVPPKAGTYEIAAYEYFEYDELVKLESLNGGSGWSGAWIDYGATNEKQGHYILSQTSRGNTDSSQSDGIYALNQRSSMTYPGLNVSGNYLGGINWQTDVPTKSYRELYRKFGEDIYVQFLVQFNDFDNADDTKVKNNYFILQEDDTERLVIRRKNGRIYMAKTTSSSASNDIVDTGVALKGSTDAQLVVVNIGASKTKIWVDPDLSSFDYSNPPVENAYLNYSFEFNRINIESQNKYINGVPSLYDEITIFERSGSLSDTDSDNIVSNSDVVTITATFSESMAATPTLSLSGIITNTEMTATASASVWTYAWTVSTTVTSTTATVYGTDLAGNAYAGTDSITFTIDNSVPTVKLTDTDSDNLISNSDVVTITATFSESMSATPTLSLSGIITNAQMTANASDSVWTYAWTVSTSINSTTATVSGKDLSGNAYAGSDSITFTIDNVPPKAGTYEIAAYEYFEYDELVKLESLNGGSGWSGAWIDYGATNEKQGHYILSQTSRGNTDSSQSDGIYALNQRSSMTYPGLNVSGNYLGGINWQTDVPTKSYRELYRKFGEDIYVQFLVQFNDFDNADDTKVKNNYFILQEDDTERLVIRRKNGRIYMAKTTSSSASNDIVDTGVALKGSTDAQLVVVNIGASKTKIWVDPDLSSFDYSNPPVENAYLNYSFEFNRINIESQNKYINGVPSLYDEITIFERSGSLSDTDSDNIVSNSDVVTITATFSESMAATPTLSLSGIITNTEMTATASASVWTYAWTVSTTVTSTTATVYGTDLAGNAYAGTDSITFTIDNSVPTVKLTDTDSDNLISNSDVVTITATFSESMSATPTLSLSGIITNAQMTANASDSVWTYAWTVSTSINSTTATVSGKDLSGNAYAGSDSITFTIDNVPPKAGTYEIAAYEYFEYDELVKLESLNGGSGWSGAWIDYGATNEKQGHYILSQTSRGNTDSSQSDGIYALNQRSSMTYPGLNVSGNYLGGINWQTDVPTKSYRELYRKFGEDIYVQFLVQFNDFDNADDTKVKNNYFILQEDDTERLVIRRKNGRIYMAKTTSSSASNDIVDTGVALKGSTDAQLVVVNIGASKTKIWVDPDLSSFDYSNPPVENAYLNYSFEFNRINIESQNKYINGVPSLYDEITIFERSGSLSDTDSDNIVSNSDVVTITANFSESMAATPTLSLSGIITNTEMTATASASVWTYAWTVSTTVTSTTATVYGTDLAGNAYAGTDSITFTIDNSVPTVKLTDTDSDNLISNSDVVTITATFSESMSATPTLSLSGIITNAQMTANASDSVWTYAWTVSTSINSTTATVSGKDLAGNAYAGTDSLVFQIKPLNYGEVSPIKSTISIAPQEMIANSLNSAIITVQAKDSLGQNFLTGGAKIRIFALSTEYTVLDNNNGTYSASFIPDAIQTDTKDINFSFSVEGITATNEFSLLLHRDQDGDGVYDIDDVCLDTEPGLEVDEKGCALNQLDSDNDGVFDDVDECPNTPEFEINNIIGTENYGELIATVVDEKGCGASQTDTDDDGIFDDVDNCVEEPNPDQLDTDGDGIGDVCDTDNPLPEIDFTPISIVEKPENGTIVGTVNAVDPDGETVSYTLVNGLFTGILSIDSVTGALKVENGSGLTLNSQYNGSLVEVIVSDGTNEINASVALVILEAPKPPEIIIVTFEVSEDVEVGTLVGVIEVFDPMGGSIVSTELSGDGYLELVDSTSSTLINTVGGRVVKEIRTVQELDYEELTEHPFTITATSSGFEEIPSLTASNSESVRVVDIPNTTYTGRFFISIFNVSDETLGAKVDHRRYFNPYNKNVGKWKVKKRVAGGADADKFTIKTRSKTDQKNDDPIEDENEDYLDFITPPDYENPGDANGDNIYEVEVEYVNTDDGAPEVPIVVTQTNIQVPEGSTTTIELQSQPVLPTDDNDGDGVPDIIDNSPLVANADQTDEDGDGVGDVSDDFDHDGVWNPFDICPDTPLGEIVDSNGCLIYYIPSSNFSISKTEKCAGTNSINIEVVDTSITYNVSVSGATTLSDSFSSSSWSLDNLSAGVYSICITVEGVSSAEFERCFEVTISEPDPLIVNSMFNKNDQTITFGLNGGVSYDITHNGITTQTTKSSYTVSLAKGLNRISISTGIECQGLFENTYLNSYEVKYAPNPFSSELTFTIGGEDRVFGLEVYTPSGQLIDQKVITLPFGIRYYTLQTDNYKQGGYFIRVKGSTIDQSFQVIKE